MKNGTVPVLLIVTPMKRIELDPLPAEYIYLSTSSCLLQERFLPAAASKTPPTHGPPLARHRAHFYNPAFPRRHSCSKSNNGRRNVTASTTNIPQSVQRPTRRRGTDPSTYLRKNGISTATAAGSALFPPGSAPRNTGDSCYVSCCWPCADSPFLSWPGGDFAILLASSTEAPDIEYSPLAACSDQDPIQ
jgi:hypothetical protein